MFSSSPETTASNNLHLKEEKPGDTFDFDTALPRIPDGRDRFIDP